MADGVFVRFEESKEGDAKIRKFEEKRQFSIFFFGAMAPTFGCYGVGALLILFIFKR